MEASVLAFPIWLVPGEMAGFCRGKVTFLLCLLCSFQMHLKDFPAPEYAVSSLEDLYFKYNSQIDGSFT